MSFSKEEIHNIVLKQREYFLTNETLSVKFRKEQLKTLKRAILENQDQLIKALHEDLGRCEVEAYFCDIGDVIMEINEYIKGLKKTIRILMNLQQESIRETEILIMRVMPYLMPWQNC